MSPEEVIEQITGSVTLARNLCGDVEWSAQDATRTERDVLRRCVEAAIRAGADPVSFAAALVSLLHVLPRLTKPIATMVHGDALAGGSALVAAVDYAVCVPGARIGSQEVGAGIWPMIAQVPLVHRIGLRPALENIGSGEPFSARRAHEVGLVQEVVESPDLRPRAERWLRLAQRAAGAYRLGRPSLYEFASMDYDEALDAALRRFAAMFKETS